MMELTGGLFGGTRVVMPGTSDPSSARYQRVAIPEVPSFDLAVAQAEALVEQRIERDKKRAYGKLWTRPATGWRGDSRIRLVWKKPPVLVTADMVKNMKPGSVIVDVAIDQGGCCETSRPTTHEQPTYVVDEVVHYVMAEVKRTFTPGQQHTDLAQHSTRETLLIASVVDRESFGIAQ